VRLSTVSRLLAITAKLSPGDNVTLLAGGAFSHAFEGDAGFDWSKRLSRVSWRAGDAAAGRAAVAGRRGFGGFGGFFGFLFGFSKRDPVAWRARPRPVRDWLACPDPKC
jgi:hypothetical protein